MRLNIELARAADDSLLAQVLELPGVAARDTDRLDR
jgi:hypothetical protein